MRAEKKNRAGYGAVGAADTKPGLCRELADRCRKLDIRLDSAVSSCQMFPGIRQPQSFLIGWGIVWITCGLKTAEDQKMPLITREFRLALNVLLSQGENRCRIGR
jgi:hypothetical protein